MCANLHSDLACCLPVTEVLYETRTVSLHKSLAFILPKLPPKCTETRKGIAVNDKTVNFVMILPQFGLDGPDICEIWGSYGDEYEYDCPLGCWDLMMEAVSTSETSISIQQTKWRNIPEDSHRHPDDTHVEGTCISGTWAPCCRVLLEKLTVAQLQMKCTAVTVFRGPAPRPIPWPHARTYTHYSSNINLWLFFYLRVIIPRDISTIKFHENIQIYCLHLRYVLHVAPIRSYLTFSP
jgi:hypothetical protein